MDKQRKERPTVTIDQYLELCQVDLDEDAYLQLEERRYRPKRMGGAAWVRILRDQNLRCFYCETDLRVIQRLIINGVIKPRKRGPDGLSGIHFELDHKDADKNNNEAANLVACCYYCNNDKSNTIPSGIFKAYFAPCRQQSFMRLCADHGIAHTDKFRHNLRGK